LILILFKKPLGTLDFRKREKELQRKCDKKLKPVTVAPRDKSQNLSSAVAARENRGRRY